MVMSEKKKNREDLRTKHIDVRMSESEYEQIALNAKMTGLNNAAYLRALGMNYPLKSVVDQLALKELIKSQNELGELREVCKLWLEKESTLKESKMALLIDNLIRNERELIEIAKKLLEK